MNRLDQPTHQEAFSVYASIGKALSLPDRIEILEVLSQGVERTVSFISQEIERPLKDTSKKLRYLESIHLAACRRSGREQLYSLKLPSLPYMLSTLQQCFDELNPQAKAKRDDLRILVLTGRPNVKVVDVRPAEEQARIRLDRTIQLPLVDLDGHELDSQTNYFTLGRSRTCRLAIRAAEAFSKRGLSAAPYPFSVYDFPQNLVTRNP